jgi:GTP-binding protein
MAIQRHPPPAVNGKRIKPKYMAQTKARPPTFVLFATRADQLPESYRRYLINSLRESFDLPGVPLRITIKSGANPYVADEGARPWLADQGRGGPKQSSRKTTVGGKTGSGARPAFAAKKTAGPKTTTKPGRPVKISPLGKPSGRRPGPKRRG